jgi:NAD(P)-dependent dehydrogenase (short-subunit alcohol dehydrogenase family)
LTGVQEEQLKYHASDEVFKTNVVGIFRLVLYFLPAMKANA